MLLNENELADIPATDRLSDDDHHHLDEGHIV